MAIDKFSDDMSIIGRLSDAPVPNGDMTTQEFKDRFDAAGKAIQTYINTKLTEQAAEKPEGTAILKADGKGNFVSAEAGKDYQAPLVEKDITLSLLADDVTGKLVTSVVSVELAVDKWAENTQTVDVAGVTASNHLTVSPAPEDFIVYCEAQIRATAQEDGKVTFKCEDVPAEAVTVLVLIVG